MIPVEQKILPWVCLAFVGFVMLTFLVLIPNAKESAIANRDMQWRDSLASAPVVGRDTSDVGEEGHHISKTRLGNLSHKHWLNLLDSLKRSGRWDNQRPNVISFEGIDDVITPFYHESPETLASQNASVSFTLRETVNRETGEFAHSFEDIRFKYPQITNTVAVNAPPVTPPFFRGVYVKADIGSEFKRFQPFVDFGIGLGFDIPEAEIKVGFGATYFERLEPMYYYKLGATWWL